MTGRRTNGEGTLYRRKDGRWEGAAYLGTVNGKVRRLRVYGKTRAEAHTKLTLRLADAERGVPTPDRSWTVTAYLDYWLANNTKLRPKTRELYEGAIRNHINPMVGSCTLDRLTVPILQRLLNEQRAAGKTARTVELIRTVLSAALTQAMRDELLVRNVARLVTLDPSDADEADPWTAEEATKFLNHIRQHPLYPAFLILMVYGLRRGEVLGLRWSDIDLERNIIRVRQQLQQVRNHLELGPVKTKAGRRDLPLLPIVRDALSEHLARRSATTPVGDEMIEGVPVDSSVLARSSNDIHDANATRQLTADEVADLIMVGRTGMPLWPRNFNRAFDRLRREAEVRWIKLHWLRHGAANLHKKFGTPAKDAQIILGHAHITTTLQIYQHGDTDIQQIALDRISRVLLDGDDGTRSRQTLPSIVHYVDKSTAFASGGTSGARTHDTLLKSLARLGRDPSLTSVFKHLRARTNTHILGCVAVKNCRQRGQFDNANVLLVLSEWFPLRVALTPITTPVLAPPFKEVTDGPTNSTGQEPGQ
ncbi:site-specific integrase [Nocardia nova]